MTKLPKIQLDDRIMVLILPVMFIVFAIAAANFVLKWVLGISLFDMPVYIQFPIHAFFLYLIYKLIRAIFH